MDIMLPLYDNYTFSDLSCGWFAHPPRGHQDSYSTYSISFFDYVSELRNASNAKEWGSNGDRLLPRAATTTVLSLGIKCCLQG